ncbi:hypothetical protein RclHR1_08370001 [Rhizophagus clarus]|uniref:Uncharacterized protein n=1 Tax=Rhizophagus clarus TaxID=94130 RepID=A0A2Z6S0S3_9GLOM|nr:hypothetical protein RclHR1_08370001 [Rhizophagus clarus]GES75389.1 hypothetical protein GLOIN_2v1867248 [Rhizophagus clarus]
MDLGWCPVCDKHTFAVENLYCSEACRKKDASSTLNEKWFYKFPRCSSQKSYQSPNNSPYNSPYNSQKSTPESSPVIYPKDTTTIMEYNFQLPCIISSSDLLISSLTNQTRIRQ